MPSLLFVFWSSWVSCSSGLEGDFSPSNMSHATINQDGIEFEWVKPRIKVLVVDITMTAWRQIMVHE
jgi:hypothetical protein